LPLFALPVRGGCSSASVSARSEPRADDAAGGPGGQPEAPGR